MKIGVMADSHDNVPLVEQAVALFAERKVALVVHAGDFVAPFAVAPLKRLGCRVLAVRGNNDGEQVGLAKAFTELGELHPYLATTGLGGRRIAAVHYPDLALPLARSGDFDLVVYGHTHEVDVRREGDTMLLNPGETGAWLTGRATVAIVDLEPLEAEIVELG